MDELTGQKTVKRGKLTDQLPQATCQAKTLACLSKHGEPASLPPWGPSM